MNSLIKQQIMGMITNWPYFLNYRWFTKGWFRLSLFVAGICAIWIAFDAISPKHISISVNFTDEDVELFKDEMLKEYPLCNISSKLDKCDNGKNIIDYHYGHLTLINDGRAFQVHRSKFGDREGKVSAFTRSNAINQAVNRTIDTYDSIDFSDGWVIKNEVYGIKSFLTDHSIMPGLKERFFVWARVAAICCAISWIMLAFILPFFIAISIAVSKCILSLIHRYICWILRGFLEEHKNN
jgi:hypothetical protein